MGTQKKNTKLKNIELKNKYFFKNLTLQKLNKDF